MSTIHMFTYALDKYTIACYILIMRTLVNLSIALTLLTTSAYAAFVPVNSVRSAAMANSSLASLDESASLFTNPSGIAKIASPECSLMYSRYYAGLSGVGSIGMGYLSLALPTRYGNLGLGIAQFSASELKSERTIALSYALNVTKRIQTGMTAKYLHHSYDSASDPTEGGDPVFKNGSSKSALSLDLGMSMTIAGPLKGGMAIRNINEPNMGLAGSDKASREIQGGFLLDLKGVGLKATGDMVQRESGLGSRGKNLIPLLGIEKRVAGERLALRAGASTLDITAGFGLKFSKITLDYAMVFSKQLSEGNAGTHRLGMTFQFGNEKPTASRTSKIKTHKAANVVAAGDYNED